MMSKVSFAKSAGSFIMSKPTFMTLIKNVQ
jgi:hypothetical protein